MFNLHLSYPYVHYVQLVGSSYVHRNAAYTWTLLIINVPAVLLHMDIFIVHPLPFGHTSPYVEYDKRCPHVHFLKHGLWCPCVHKVKRWESVLKDAQMR